MKSYEVFGHILDFYRLAHIKKEYFPAFCLTAGLQNKLNRFGNGHKESRHILMGDRYGAAGGNLFFK